MEPTRDSKEDIFHKYRNRWKVAGLLFFCFVAAFLGAWGAIEAGFIKGGSKEGITQNKETVVLQEGEVIADVFNKTSPAVVSITTKSIAADPFFGRQTQSEGAGTGMIVSKDGYILTNKHVIPEGAESVTVVRSDGTSYENVRIIGRDPTNDIAFLKIEGVSDLPTVSLGNSDSVRVGQKVVAIGNALGQFQNTVTQGIISGSGRPIEAQDGGQSESLTNLLQTDAAINPGNSGGPLVNINGEVIGINTAIAQEAEGIGFAIPINDAKGLLDGVLAQGRLVRPFLGVQYIMLTPGLARQLNAKLDYGALVYAASGSAVVAGSPAEKAGLERGDIITKVNGQDVNSQASLASRLSHFKPGDEIELKVYRGDKEVTFKAKLEEYKP